MLIAELGQVDIIQAEVKDLNSSTLHVTDFPATAQKHPNITILPQPQMIEKTIATTDGHSYDQIEPLTWTVIEQSDGSIYEQLEQLPDREPSRNPRGGAYVLVGNELQVIDASEIDKFQVGQDDCRSIQTLAFTIRSDQKETDLKSLAETKTLSGLSPDSDTYCSFVVTFQTQDGETKTHVISIYNHFDEENGAQGGKPWPLLQQLDPINATEICDQIMAEQGYDQYIIAVPDANEYSSLVITDTITDQQRQDYKIKTETGYYQDDQPFARTLWSQPYRQVKMPRFFLAATGK